MASVNKVILVGNIGKDPEMRYMPNGDAVANITLATTDTWKDKQTGEKREAVEWHRIVFFRKLAEIVGQYLKKGSQVYIEGSLKTRKWEKDGHTNYTTEIVADSMQMLGSRQGMSPGMSSDGFKGSNDAPPRDSGYGAAPAAEGKPAPAAQTSSKFNDFEDDIPF